MVNLKQRLYEIIFGHETVAGKRFDVYLLWMILLSSVVVMLESISEIRNSYSREFTILEWLLTGLFTVEFLLRIWISPKPLRYIFSFWGIIDFLAILPSYLGLFVFNYHYLLIIRIFRLLRVFRILQLTRFTVELQVIMKAMQMSWYKISVFLILIVIIVTFMGTAMYVVEDGSEGFSSIPQSIYWAIVTVTTVGYGDMVPHTVLGKILSSIAMILGYAIIAVPTSIITLQLSKTVHPDSFNCRNCNSPNDLDAVFCKRCGKKIEISREE